MRDLLIVVKVLTLLVLAIGGSLLIWWWGYSFAHGKTSVRMSVMYAATVIPCALGFYLLTRRWRDSRPRLLPILVFLAFPLSAIVATLIAWSSGEALQATVVNMPAMGCNFGWLVGGGLRIAGAGEKPGADD